VQVLRTYPACRKPYPFAPEGERSIARAYIKAVGRARSLVYLEDQYLWSFHATRVLCDALRKEPELLIVIVIPRYPDPDGRISGGASVWGRARVQDALYAAGRNLRPRARGLDRLLRPLESLRRRRHLGRHRVRQPQPKILDP
jgi:hypothetical protein